MQMVGMAEVTVMEVLIIVMAEVFPFDRFTGAQKY